MCRFETAKKKGEYDDESRRRENAKASLERYMHYFERYDAHSKAREKVGVGWLVGGMQANGGRVLWREASGFGPGGTKASEGSGEEYGVRWMKGMGLWCCSSTRTSEASGVARAEGGGEGGGIVQERWEPMGEGPELLQGEGCVLTWVVLLAVARPAPTPPSYPGVLQSRPYRIEYY